MQGISLQERNPGGRVVSEPWMISAEEFLGTWPNTVWDDEFERACEASIEEHEGAWSRGTVRNLVGFPNFEWSRSLREPQDVLLLLRSPYGDLTLEGGYVEHSLWLSPSIRGRGLASELVLLKAELVGGPLQAITYTMAGRAAHLSAHRLAVTRALAAGLRVPRHALHAVHLAGLPV